MSCSAGKGLCAPWGISSSTLFRVFHEGRLQRLHQARSAPVHTIYLQRACNCDLMLHISLLQAIQHGMALLDDARIQWIRQRVVLGLDLEEGVFHYMLSSTSKVRSQI